ncbi:MAG: SpoIIE family protein phosphatase [Lachnospiraceae bacterium]|nr:SpoIIE family protein phosphatase [Lachnospiraceae bacterium]
MAGRRRSRIEQDRVFEELIKNTKNQMKEISFSYEKLGHTLKKMPNRRWNLSEEEILNILGRISIEACEGCSRFYQCYRSEKGQMIEEVTDMLDQLEKHGIGVKLKVPKTFEERCLRKDHFLEELFWSYEIIGINRSWQNKMLYQRKVMASQMEEMARILFDCAAMMGYDKKGEACWEKTLRKVLKRENVVMGCVRFYENTGKRKEVFLIARCKKESIRAERVAKIIGDVLKVPMIPAKECRLAVYGEMALFHFIEDVNFQIVTGVLQKAKEGEEVCGDLFSVLRLDKGKEIFLLTDGMGSGPQAMEEGKQTLELMEQLLDTGFHEEETLRLANGAITFGIERTMYSSVDLLSINLFTGVMKIMKAGSAATFVVRKSRIEVILSKTLPAGLLWEVEFDVLYKKLYDGDSVVLVSDGVLDSISQVNPEDKLKSFLPTLYRENPGQAAEKIMDWALQQSKGQRRDDMSVMVIHIWKKNHRFRREAG